MVIMLDSVKIEKSSDMQLILGHAGFIKTAEDLYEALMNASPNIKFGIAFNEASGGKLVRSEGNDDELRKLAEKNALKIGAGHTFIILFKNAFPINVSNAIKTVVEVSEIFCATANNVEVIIAKSNNKSAVLGVIDGEDVVDIENNKDKAIRRNFVRKIGYKLK
ncbi:MAG: adenosine-specific kinase [Candidatus Marsarchaeota archaeon]|jgi:adenosine/AMP kinase|nr:adenosine-specific kinase [Candidatus Marsarchaeota archaeon]